VPKPLTCAGCKGSVSSYQAIHCVFECRPFPNPRSARAPPLRACGTCYHEGCIEVGAPFRTRHKDGRGLVYPLTAAASGFVCEACTLRAHVGRELSRTHKDVYLLKLERMRMIDVAHNWAPRTLTSYRSRLRFIRNFERTYGVVCLPTLKLDTPPITPAIPLMWAMQHYALQKPRGSHPSSGDQVSWATARALRSAASFYNEGLMALQYPASSLRDPTSKRGRLSPGRSPTDFLGFSMMAAGMAKRMGTASKPARALRLEHVLWNLRFRDRQYQVCTDPQMRLEIATAAFAEIAAFCGWLRGGEVFGMDAEDVEYVPPESGPAHGLREGIGFFQVDLLDSTKSSQDAKADIVFASETSSGLDGGMWWGPFVGWPRRDGLPGRRSLSTPFGAPMGQQLFSSPAPVPPPPPSVGGG